MVDDRSFRPISFRPEVYAGAGGPIQPALPGDNFLSGHPLASRPAGETDVKVLVIDQLGCGERLPDVEVMLANKVQPGSGGHYHIDSELPGTGTYPDSGKPSITRTTGQQGTVQARYRAGKYGLMERIKVVATRSETLTRGRSSDSLQGADRPELDIKVPGLTRVDPAANHFRYGNGCKHRDAEGKGVGRYVDDDMVSKLIVLNGYYQQWTGNNLSFNDASLPYGGYFDNLNDGGVESGCHYSHRRGIDIDVNSWDWEVEYNLRTSSIKIKGISFPIREKLDGLAEKIDLIRILEEDSIHYRIIRNI